VNVDNKNRIQKLKEVLEKNPGAEAFVELANLLSDSPENRIIGREVCFKGLTLNPKNLRGRLCLARLFYLDKMGEHCVRELVELKKQTNVPSLDRLIKEFGEFAKPYLLSVDSDVSKSSNQDLEKKSLSSETKQGDDDILAEIDLESELLDILDEIEDGEEK
jgi:hypothetical protein